MTPQAGLFFSAIAFVVTHFLMSHPLRAAMVRAMGEGAFKGVYSLVSLLTFGAMVYFYRKVGAEPAIFTAPDWAWSVCAVVMWFASILFVGAFRKNPALMGDKVGHPSPVEALRVTRHPLMWGIAVWAAVHWALIGTPKAMVFDVALIILALGGAAGQDRKKEKLLGDAWYDWESKTSFFPFGRGLTSPGLVPIVGGTLLFLIATYFHPIPVGLWRYIGGAS